MGKENFLVAQALRDLPAENPAQALLRDVEELDSKLLGAYRTELATNRKLFTLCGLLVKQAENARRREMEMNDRLTALEKKILALA